MPFTLAIIGRPNVGKSTLFNRLVGQRLALVDDRPGVTRDLREGDARLGPLSFSVVDTAGLETATDDSLQGRMRRLTERAIASSDAALFLVDARAGITPFDIELADILRRAGGVVIVGVNKAEGRQADTALAEAWSLGLGEPIALSAEHGEGMAELAGRLMPMVESHEAEDLGTDDPDKPLQLAVVGRPNAGKSTLINRIIGDDRLLTGPEAGITRDAIAIKTDWDGLKLRIFDTAGMRKKARVTERLEQMSVSDGLRAVRFAELVVVLLDATIPFETQDLRIADLAEREGRAVVIALNKWDLIDAQGNALTALRAEVDRLLPQLKGAEVVTLSAETGQGLAQLRRAIERAADVWNRRVATGTLNRWLAEMVSQHPPPAPGGKRIKLRYMTQVKSRPPSFVAMCSHPDALPESYKRYLIGGLREHFKLPGTPIRLTFRSQADRNPYRNKRVKQPSRLSKHLTSGPRQK